MISVWTCVPVPCVCIPLMTAGICVVKGVCSCVCVTVGICVCGGGTVVVATVTSRVPSGGDSTSPYMYGGVGGFSPLTEIWTQKRHSPHAISVQFMIKPVHCLCNVILTILQHTDYITTIYSTWLKVKVKLRPHYTRSVV